MTAQKGMLFKMSLLDDHNYYFVEKKGKLLEDTKILNEKGQPIGIIKINRDLKQIEVQELDGKMVFSIKKPSRIFSKYEVKNEKGEVEANFKSKKAQKIVMNLKPSNQTF